MEKAERDFNSAKKNFKIREYHLVAFHRHQAIEKGLKGLYIEKFSNMVKKKSIIAELRRFKRNTSEEMPIKKLIFFGSRAKKSGKPERYSDIDLVVVSSVFKNMRFFERPVKLYNYWKLNYPVDFLCYTPEEFAKMKKQITIVREAVREGIEI